MQPILSGSGLGSCPGPGDSQCEYNITMNNFLGPFYWWLGEVVARRGGVDLHMVLCHSKNAG